MTYSQILYAVVNEGLGLNLIDYSVFSQMQQTYFTTPADINTYLLPQNPVTDLSVLDALFNDPFYGLSNPQNYAHWQAFMLESQEPEIKNKRIAWGTELCFYFGLTKAQVESMYTNWRTVYTASYNTVRATIPSLSTYQNSVGYGYWQWADSWVTEPDNISVAGLGTNTIQGYYEMSYWQ
jgi:hypothetical protein